MNVNRYTLNVKRKKQNASDSGAKILKNPKAHCKSLGIYNILRKTMVLHAFLGYFRQVVSLRFRLQLLAIVVVHYNDNLKVGHQRLHLAGKLADKRCIVVNGDVRNDIN